MNLGLVLFDLLVWPEKCGGDRHRR